MTTKKPTKWGTPGESLQPDVDIGEWNVLHLGTFATNVVRRNHRIVNAYRPHLKKPPEHLYPFQGTNIILFKGSWVPFRRFFFCIGGIWQRIPGWKLRWFRVSWGDQVPRHSATNFSTALTSETSCAAMAEKGQLLATGHQDGIRLWGSYGRKWSASYPVDCVDLLGFCLGECEQKMMPFLKGISTEWVESIDWNEGLIFFSVLLIGYLGFVFFSFFFLVLLWAKNVYSECSLESNQTQNPWGFSTPPTPNKDLLKRNAPAFERLPFFGGTGPIRGSIPNQPIGWNPIISAKACRAAARFLVEITFVLGVIFWGLLNIAGWNRKKNYPYFGCFFFTLGKKSG